MKTGIAQGERDRKRKIQKETHISYIYTYI